MSKENYIKFAAMIKEHMVSRYSGPAERIILRDLSREMADYFASDNSNFDRNRFLDACGTS
jgi:hypothetical protein